MPFTLTDRYKVTKQRLTAQQAYDYFASHGAKRLPFLKELLFKLEELCIAKGYDFANLVAQMANETDNFRSALWVEKGNPGGIGKTGTDVSTGADVSRVYETGTEAAWAMFIHSHAYIDGPIYAGSPGYDQLYLDPRYTNVLNGKDVQYGSKLPLAGSVKTIGDYNVNGRWAELVNSKYGDNIIQRGNELFPNVPNQGATTVATVTDHLNTIFGKGKWHITQEWGNDPPGEVYDDMYKYGIGHGTNGQTHPGLDVGVAYGTKMYAPADATVICAGTNIGPGFHGGGCTAFNDWGDQCENLVTKMGVGHIQLLFDNGKALIFGHSRTCLVTPGQRVVKGQQIGTTGGMCGAHIHLEAQRWQNGTYWLFNPRELLLELPAISTPVEPAEPGGPTVALPIRQQMIPAGNRNRPGTKLNDAPLYIWIHDTGNPDAGADAQMHADFVKNGGGGESVSFHGTVDDGEAIQLLPADEVGWHAGDSCDSRTNDIGCFQSFAIETCVNSDGNWTKTKENLIDFCVAIIKGDSRINFAGRKGQFSPSRIRQHNASSGKDCPHRIRAEGSWSYITGQVTSRAAGTPTEPTPPTPPVPSPEFFPGLDLAVARRLFGNVKGEDGKTYVFNATGPVSQLWMENGEETGNWPTLEEVWVYGDGRRYFKFESLVIIDPPTEAAKPYILRPGTTPA
jgi:murein DD-endopeptidase MepM/ murein hydrolase activator NlpD